MGSPPETVIDAPAAERALERFQNQPLDRYDPFVLEAASSAGVIQVLTNDGDFASGAGLRAFSADRNLITAARVQGKPVQR